MCRNIIVKMIKRTNIYNYFILLLFASNFGVIAMTCVYITCMTKL